MGRFDRPKPKWDKPKARFDKPKAAFDKPKQSKSAWQILLGSKGRKKSK